MRQLVLPDREGALRHSRRGQRRNGSANRSQDHAGVPPPNAHGDAAAPCRCPWQNDGNSFGISVERPLRFNGKHHAEAEVGIVEGRVIAKEEPPGGSAVDSPKS